MAQPAPEIATIALHSITYQGDVVRHYSDGQVTIDTSVEVVTAQPVRKVQKTKKATND